MSITKDFKKFSPRKYLLEQYREMIPENRFMLRFLHEAYREFGRKGVRVLEVGGGPTVYQLISASGWAKEIVFTDFLEENIDEVRKWVEKEAAAFDWGEYVRIVAGMEGRKQSVAVIEKRLRGALKTFLAFDVLGKQQTLASKFDVVSSHFCAESITNDEKEFQRAVRTIASFVAPRGMLVMSLLKGAKIYEVGDRTFPAYLLDESKIKTLLKRLGFTTFNIQTIEVETNGEDNANICLWARR